MTPLLRKQALVAEIATLEVMLASRDPDDDPIGFSQLGDRASALRQQLEEIDADDAQPAAVALFFAGAPVLGSMGIRAEFAGKAVKFFQDIVSKRFSTFERGDLGERGPLSLRMNSDLMITDVARGSFGIVLREAAHNLTLVRTELSVVLEEVARSIDVVGKDDVEAFELFMAEADPRYLQSLGEFFTLLDDERATIRVVEGGADRSLDSGEVRVARERVASVVIKEVDWNDKVGRLFILPEHRRFELRTDAGETIYGIVSAEFPRETLETARDSADVVSQRWRVRIRERSIARPNRQPKKTNVLLGLVERVSD